MGQLLKSLVWKCARRERESSCLSTITFFFFVPIYSSFRFLFPFSLSLLFLLLLLLKSYFYVIHFIHAAALNLEKYMFATLNCGFK